MTFTHALATNNYGPAKFIVDASAANGTHTTIASALTAASSGDTIFIRPGTYTENLTLKAGVNLAAYSCDAFTPNVTISGTCSFSASGTCTISGIRLQTNSANCVSVTGASSVLKIVNCYINATNNTAIAQSNGTIEINFSQGDLATTGIALFALTGGSLQCYNSRFMNSGTSTTASTNANGSLVFEYSLFAFPITVSGTTGSINAAFTEFVPGDNTICLTQNSTTVTEMVLRSCFLFNNVASAISIGAGSNLTVVNAVIRSAGTNVITGSGTIRCSGIEFEVNNGYNVTTVVPLSTGLINVNANQPAFLAFPSGNTANATGNATNFTCIFNTEIYDQNSNFASNTFTSPFTARYQLGASISMSTIGAAHTSGFAQIVTSNRTYAIWEVSPAATRDAGAILVLGGFTHADMDAGDTATVNLNIAGSTQTVTYLSSSYFSGELTT